MSAQKKPVNYINNAEFLQHLNDYITLREYNKEHDLSPPQIPDVIGKIFVQIATKLSTRYNFNGYSYKDEMVGDGILNAIEAVDNFNPNKSSNAFAYFTQIIFWAFVRRIKYEKKEFDGKTALMFDNNEENCTLEHGDVYEADKSNIFLFYNS